MSSQPPEQELAIVRNASLELVEIKRWVEAAKLPDYLRAFVAAQTARLRN
jgi:hypothetical protein